MMAVSDMSLRDHVARRASLDTSPPVTRHLAACKCAIGRAVAAFGSA